MVTDRVGRSGFHVGPTLLVQLPSTGWGIDASLLYEQCDAQTSMAFSDVEPVSQRQRSLCIPLNLRLHLAGSGSAFGVYGIAGPQFRMNFDDDVLLRDAIASLAKRSTLKTTDLSLNLGVCTMFFGHLQASLTYNLRLGRTSDTTKEYLQNLHDDIVGHADSNYWQVSMALFF